MPLDRTHQHISSDIMQADEPHTPIDPNGGGGLSSPLTADLDAAGHTITNLADPVDDGDAATKSYVDGLGGLPDAWTDGGHGDVTATVDADVVPITVRANVGQTANMQEWRDENDALVAQVEFDGGFANFNSFRVRATAPGTTYLQAGTDGQVYVRTGGDPWTAISDLTGGAFFKVGQLGGGGSIVEVDPADGDRGITINAGNTPTKDMIVLYGPPDYNGEFRVLPGGAVVIAQRTAPADGELIAGQMALWFDATNGASKLMVKAKTADGTVVTGSVNLT